MIGHENEVDFIRKSAAQELRKAKTEINTASGFVLDSMQIIILMTYTLDWTNKEIINKKKNQQKENMIMKMRMILRRMSLIIDQILQNVVHILVSCIHFC